MGRLLAVAVLVVLVACGPSADPHRAATLTPSPILSLPTVTVSSIPHRAPVATGARQTDPCQAISPGPTFSPPAPSNRHLAIVTLAGSSKPVVRDITDISHPSTVATLDVMARFVSAADVSYIDGNGDLVRQTYGSSTKLTVARCVALFDWNPDGTAVAYAVSTDLGMTVHELVAGHDQVLG